LTAVGFTKEKSFEMHGNARCSLSSHLSELVSNGSSIFCFKLNEKVPTDK